MDIKSFKKRVYKNSRIRNSLISFCILIPVIVLLLIFIVLGTTYDGLLFSLLFLFSLFLLAMIFKLYYNLFLFRIDKDDTRISIKTDVVEIRFKLYDELYGKYGAKSFGLIIKIKVDNRTIKVLYPFAEDIRFGVKKEDWNQKNEILNRLNKIKQINVTYFERSKIIVNKIDAIDHIINKVK